MAKAVRICNDITNYPFDTILETTKLCECTDARDRVYGLLSLVNGEIDVIPDNTKAAEQIFEETARNAFKNSNKLDLLSYCELQLNQLNMPSWVPNFSVPKATKNLRSKLVASTLSGPLEIGTALKV